jgi:MPBQ/MSBQ methyltransferase
MRLIQHKKEAYWFYRFLSTGYDRWVNPLFWTPAMRSAALDAARLDERRLRTLDAGAGTGFTTEGIVERVDADCVTMLDQSPHQLRHAERKPALERCTKVLGDAEALPLPTDHFDRYVSAGSIEYWPAPERGIAEAYRVLAPGGVALVVGPVPPGDRILRALAELWMLFPTEDQYREWFERAGFEDVSLVTVAPEWYRDRRSRYGVAVTGRKPVAGPSPLTLGATEDLSAPLSPRERLKFAGRFVLGSLAGAVFVPVGIALALRARLGRAK